VWPKLYRRRVKHDADGSTEGLGREVRPELGADNAGVAVRPGDLAPDDTDLGALDGALGAVDVCALVSACSHAASSYLRLYVQATRLPAYHCAAAVSSTPSSLSREVPGLVLRFLLRCERRTAWQCVFSRTLAGSCALLADVHFHMLRCALTKCACP
jgi:hypothetical protein